MAGTAAQVVCDALTWAKDDKDYVRCDDSEIQAVTLKGVMLTVGANLCGAHQRYIAGNPSEWASVEIRNAATGHLVSKYKTIWDRDNPRKTPGIET